MECRKGDYICLAGNYYCLKTDKECSHRDYNLVKEIQIQDATGRTDHAYNGCDLAARIERETRKTPAPFQTIR